ncbi:MAG: hypothetical protein EBU90_03165 [Proteobacteria bacterium]|nr:hypothetical protein [Pseudomonadota bacterium]NBP13326.1 hypothetical protein [bacterium]
MDYIMQFFDMTRPCPEQIQDCEKHRAAYTAEYEAIKSKGGCGTCMERNLKQRYIGLLQQFLKL